MLAWDHRFRPRAIQQQLHALSLPPFSDPQRVRWALDFALVWVYACGLVVVAFDRLSVRETFVVLLPALVFVCCCCGYCGMGCVQWNRRRKVRDLRERQKQENLAASGLAIRAASRSIESLTSSDSFGGVTASATASSAT